MKRNLKENQEVREIQEDVNDGVIVVYEDNLSELSVDNEEEMDALFAQLEEMSIQELALEQIIGFARIYRDDEDQIQISDVDYREEEFKNEVNEIVNEYLGKNDSYKAQSDPLEDNYDEFLKESISQDRLEEIRQDMIQLAGDDISTGHTQDPDSKEEFIVYDDESYTDEEVDKAWEIYQELVDLGPSGFYSEFKDDYEFDDDFIAEFGDEFLEEDITIKPGQGWDIDEDDMQELLDVQGTIYEIENGARGAYTNAKTYSELATRIRSLSKGLNYFADKLDNYYSDYDNIEEDNFNNDLYESIEQSERKLADVEDKDQGKVSSVYAAAIRSLKQADKKRQEARKLPNAPKHDENPKNPKMVSGAKKMHLDESLFQILKENSNNIDSLINNVVNKLMDTYGNEVGMEIDYDINDDSIELYDGMGDWGIEIEINDSILNSENELYDYLLNSIKDEYGEIEERNDSLSWHYTAPDINEIEVDDEGNIINFYIYAERDPQPWRDATTAIINLTKTNNNKYAPVSKFEEFDIDYEFQSDDGDEIYVDDNVLEDIPEEVKQETIRVWNQLLKELN